LSRPAVGRLVAAGLASLALAGLVAWALRPGLVEGPARVEAVAEYRVSHAGDGRVRWTLLDGEVPGGPAVVADGLIQGERGDPVQVRRAPGLVAGTLVGAGDLVAAMTSSRLAADAEVVAAERDALLAERALLDAGGRSDNVATRQQAVDVAEAALALQDAQVDHVAELVDRGAEGAWSLEEARRKRDVQQAEVDLARARLAEARKLPRSEEQQRIDARLREIDARLAAAQARQQGQELRSPIAGVVGTPAGDVLVSVIGDEGAVLQVAVDEAARGQVRVGDRVDFVPTADGLAGAQGVVLDIGDTATSLGGRPVVWAVARLDGDVPIGATGRAMVVSGATP